MKWLKSKCCMIVFQTIFYWQTITVSLKSKAIFTGLNLNWPHVCFFVHFFFVKWQIRTTFRTFYLAFISNFALYFNSVSLSTTLFVDRKAGLLKKISFLDINFQHVSASSGCTQFQSCTHFYRFYIRQYKKCIHYYFLLVYFCHRICFQSRF